MSYLEFHLVFLVPPLLLLALRFPEAVSRLGSRAPIALPLVALIALAYTTPWDNYLVARGIWWYGEDRVIGTLGFVPIEEYLFFILQPLLTGAFLYHLLAGTRGEVGGRGGWRSSVEGDSGSAGSARSGLGLSTAGALPWLVLAGIGVWLLLRPDEKGTYMGLILVWACPLPGLMWLFMGHSIRRIGRQVTVSIAIPTLYLWVADRIAIGEGIWEISSEHTFGWNLFGLPIEEAAFFLLTNTLVVFGTSLILMPSMGPVGLEPTT